ncbi:MAG: 2-hydroxychromene-2-carboxylate isomerase [Candidatus Binatia bacterium]
MSDSVLQFWFEFASTYSYLAAGRIEDAAARAGVVLEWKPFLLGPIFRGQGWTDSPFNLYPVKGRYMWRDTERLCEKYRLPFKKPTAFPRNGLLAARVACLASDAPWCPEFVRAVYRANFAENRDIADAAMLAALLDAIGQPGPEVVARAQSPENKERLRQQTGVAATLGIFGAPTFVVGSEVFWGNDRLEDALAWCQRSSV